MRDRVELLAPAGNYEAFIGAVNAGADAVYLGGDRFGARAYADNFTTEEICRALHTAHFLGRKVYLTVNTLVKDAELDGLYGWLAPFYEAGLDGVIVQDIGVLCHIRENFPDLALHASTQMTLTGAYGASFLHKQGVRRIVPARELSLEEIRTLKEETGLEIECFIHGAMCYSYSGQCLFSSILGGRSGNRGRCAQPCRLPYRVCIDGEETEEPAYPLSLKDMCTIEYLPRLIEAGVDSFKIEGRMKKPEYAAGVTAIYRKYLDLCEETGPEGFRVSREDMDMLRSLYIRSEVQNGYYERHNGREMITLHRPGYAGSSRQLLDEIGARYVHRAPDRKPVRMHAVLNVGETAVLTVSDEDGVSVSVSGGVVEKARNRPLEREDVVRQLVKTGDSLVEAAECSVTAQGDVFLPVSALNELRRRGVEAYENRCIASRKSGAGISCSGGEKGTELQGDRLTESVDNNRRLAAVSGNPECGKRKGEIRKDILVSTQEQLAVAVLHPCRRVYLESDLFMEAPERISALMCKCSDREYYLALPRILRLRDAGYLNSLAARLPDAVAGFLIRNYEAAAYVEELAGAYGIVPDAGMYVFNREGLRFWARYGGEFTFPYELNAGECRELAVQADKLGSAGTLVVYGRIPMMLSANCVRKSAGRCPSDLSGSRAPGGQAYIRDRYGVYFPVETNCVHCYNVIYNSVPYSLHLQPEDVRRTGADIWRYDFTVESGEDCRRILSGADFPYEKYTTGHFKRGVE